MPRATEGGRRERMLILLDATAAHGRDSAISEYIDAIVCGLDTELVVACRADDAERYRRLAPGATIEAGPAVLRWSIARMLWRQFELPRIARRHDVDAVHSVSPPVPILLARPRVVTVHSMATFERTTTRQPGDALRRIAVRTAVRLADEVVVLSADVAAELERALGFSSEDVLVTPPATDFDRFAEAHLVAYRSAASLVPSTTGPVQLLELDDAPPEPAQ